jgi:hypothetical protein
MTEAGRENGLVVNIVAAVVTASSSDRRRDA